MIFQKEAFCELSLCLYNCKATVALPSLGPCLVGDVPMAFHLLSPLLCDSSDASASAQMTCTGAHSAVSDAHRDALLDQLLKKHK